MDDFHNKNKLQKLVTNYEIFDKFYLFSQNKLTGSNHKLC